MILVTTDFITGKEIETIDLVYGSTIQTKNFFRDFGAGLKSMVGGELKDYTAMMCEAREVAKERMIEQAEALGADAVVGVKFSTSSVMQEAAEVIIYGTAVKIK